MAAPLPTFGVVILTQGRRPEDLQRGIDSLLAQRDVVLDVVVVGNGWRPVGLPPGFKALHLPDNVGIPAGRNEGVPHVSGEHLFFLDDDAWLLDVGFLADCAEVLRRDPGIGMLQPRIMDPDSQLQPRRWIPRIRKGDPTVSSDAFSVVEMAVVVRRSVFDATRGWPRTFFYAHEGIELAWRVWETGHRTVYHGQLRAGHPVINPRRHAEYLHMNARNRIWLARRNLPWPFSWAYVASWTLITLVRWWRRPEDLRSWFVGWRAGWRECPWAAGEPRRRLRWRTIAAMGAHGRWPVV
ncbi:Glycosyltransferase, GT2 family [Auraticoccus monumenti]|uniref:Glycosyltransferase, GT2 family n=1 Tax=Auraticoccus monumenti TaxID=675864 RepID=A0A1G7C5V4_9ACTN|nr:Glycosyltransferase, GT2 family [Auraticoccus monumenti]